ncbi:MAG: hypothetical protein D6813_07715 [Calditrichaeota bacterium]|nr:MAG: hypothetical protein D6813_07715 [Calditrichota bacterium]
MLNEQELVLRIHDFITNSSYEQLGIGDYQGYQVLKFFERPYSILTLVKLIGAKGTQNVYIKVYKNFYKLSQKEFEEGIQSDFETNVFWYKQLSTFKGFTTFKPLYFSIPYKMIITEECPGVNLHGLIEKNAKIYSIPFTLKKLTQYMYQAGKLLKVFQEFYKEEEYYELPLLIEDVDIRLQKLVANPYANFTETDRKKILDFYNRHLEKASKIPIPMKYIHSDFAPSNILVNKENMILHDFHKVKTGPYLWDLTRFYHQLELFKYKPFLYSPKFISKLQSAFLEGYGFKENTLHIHFHFFLLRNYFTHYVGIARLDGLPFKSFWYNKWVMFEHRRNINKIIEDSS